MFLKEKEFQLPEFHQNHHGQPESITLEILHAWLKLLKTKHSISECRKTKRKIHQCFATRKLQETHHTKRVYIIQDHSYSLNCPVDKISEISENELQE